MSEQQPIRVVGRYALHRAIAAGGMATVHLGRLLGPVGFSRTVAIKRLHAQLASDPEFVSMFLDEARLAARIRHPNVVPTLDVVATDGELFLVMDYVPGESVARLARALRERQQTVPLRILASIMAGVLHGLHAAHEAKDERGQPLGIVHRDVSPQNVIVGTDGVARVLDFGVAKAAGRVQTTREGQLKGKIAYMPPEQIRGAAVSRQTDIYSAGVMLWELLTGDRLFSGDNDVVVLAKVLEGRIERPSQYLAQHLGRALPPADLRLAQVFDGIALRALDMRPEARHATARDMALEIERACPLATASEISDWVEVVARDVLHSRAALVSEIESSASVAVDVRDAHVLSVIGSAAATPGRASGPAGTPSPLPGVPPPLPGVPPPLPGAPAATGSSLALFAPGIAFDAPPVTQPSSISVTTGAPVVAPADGPRRAIFASVIGVVLGFAVIGSAVVYRQGKRAPARTPALVPALEGGRVAPTASAPPRAEPPPAESGLEAPPAEPEVFELEDPEPSGEPPPPSGKRPSPGAVRKPPAPAPADDCATPFWYDEAGVKKYKPHCLTK